MSVLVLGWALDRITHETSDVRFSRGRISCNTKEIYIPHMQVRAIMNELVPCLNYACFRAGFGYNQASLSDDQ